MAKRTPRKAIKVTEEPTPIRETLRLHTDISRELKHLVDRVCLERKQERLSVHKQSDIVETALWGWLESQGYRRP